MRYLFLVIAITFLSNTYEATWYGGRTRKCELPKSKKVFIANKMTCASNQYDYGTIIKVVNVENNKNVVVLVNDKHTDKTIGVDLSKQAFEKLADLKTGRIKVKIKKI